MSETQNISKISTSTCLFLRFWEHHVTRNVKKKRDSFDRKYLEAISYQHGENVRDAELIFF